MARKKTPGRKVVITVRADATSRSLIARAASLAGKSRSAFILDAACEEARSALQVVAQRGMRRLRGRVKWEGDLAQSRIGPESKRRPT